MDNVKESDEDKPKESTVGDQGDNDDLDDFFSSLA